MIFVTKREFVVFAIVVVVNQLSVDDTQFMMVPVWPDKVKVVLLASIQTSLLPARVPPTEVGSTVIVTVFVVSVPQPAAGGAGNCPGGGEPAAPPEV